VGTAVTDTLGSWAPAASADNPIPNVMDTSVDSPLKLDFAATEAPMPKKTRRDVHPRIIGGIW
jgi:hypothetical protein